MKSVMLDLETMGRSPRAAIVQIGACKFDDKTGEVFSKFERNVSLQSSIDAGLEVDGKTVEFWLEQKAQTFLERREKHGDHAHITLPVPLKDALLSFFEWVRHWSLPLWCHATFDAPILAEAYRLCGLEPPWRRQDVRDLRTLVALADYERPPHDGVPHDALSDCLYQVKYCVEALKKLRTELFWETV